MRLGVGHPSGAIIVQKMHRVRAVGWAVGERLRHATAVHAKPPPNRSPSRSPGPSDLNDSGRAGLYPAKQELVRRCIRAWVSLRPASHPWRCSAAHRPRWSVTRSTASATPTTRITASRSRKRGDASRRRTPPTRRGSRPRRSAPRTPSPECWARPARAALRYSEHLQQETLLGGSIAIEPRPGTFEARAVELTRAASCSRRYAFRAPPP